MTATSTSTATSSSASASPIARTVAELRKTYNSGRTRSITWRERQLGAMSRMLQENEDAICDALAKDLGKPKLEALMAEVNFVQSTVAHLRKNLRKWARPEKVPTAMAAMPGKSEIHREPLGVVLVIAPWNYPLMLTLSPVAAALAAGNCVLAKPSEVSEATSALIAALLPRYLDNDAVRVLEGGVKETTEVLDQRFDHIFYTGNGTVGRIVMAAAAKHLTPVTLELGGKSPTIVDSDIDVSVAAKRLAWAKYYNCGQTCVAPDYALVTADVYDRFVSELRQTIETFWGSDPQKSGDMGRIINTRHHQRIMKLIEGHKALIGGTGDEADRFIAPTLLTDVDPESPIMQQEIFGPVLPVIKVADVQEAIDFINKREKPLALYLYSNNPETQKRVIRSTSSGGMVVNHGILHLSIPTLPFGGVGESGMGAYGGKFGYETFSHRKSVLTKPFSMDMDLLYPPFTAGKAKWLKRLLKLA